MNPDHPEFDGDHPVDPEFARLLERARNIIVITTGVILGRWVVPAALNTAANPIEAVQQVITGIVSGQSL
jgi:hypothetical protein